MIILFIKLLNICTGEGNKTDHQPMIYDPNKTSALNAEPFKCSAAYLSLKTFRIQTNSIHDYLQLLATALIQLYIYIDR
jgi:hypothetical protein